MMRRTILFVLIVTAGCGARSELANQGPTSSTPADSGSQPSACTLAAAVTLASFSSTDDNASAPYVHDGFLYWSETSPTSVHDWWTGDGVEKSTTVRRVPTSGGGVQALASFNARADRYALHVAYDDAFMYWAADPVGGPGETNGTIVRTNLDGSNATTLLGGLTRPNGVVLAGGKLYFTAIVQNGGGTAYRMNVDGSGEEVIGHAELPFPSETSDAVWTADYVYASEGGEGIINRVATDDEQTTELVDLWDGGLAPGEPELDGLSLQGSTGLALSWTSGNAQEPQPAEIVRWSPASGALETIATGLLVNSQSVPSPLHRTASDGVNAYATTNGSIVRVPLTGGSLETVGPTESTGGIAFDDSRVYWISYDTSTVTIYAACR